MSIIGIFLSIFSSHSKSQNLSNEKQIQLEQGEIIFSNTYGQQIQNAANLCSDSTYKQYLKKSNSAKLSKKFEVLALYESAFAKLKESLKNSTPPKGSIFIRQLYNMGYIIHTGKMTIGIDLSAKYVEQLEPYLDILLITHAHSDHFSESLAIAMKQNNKPVVSCFWQKGLVVRKDTFLRFDDVLIHTIPGDHYYWDVHSRNDILMYEIDCGELANHKTILHSGDNSNIKKVLPTNTIDVFIPHIRMGYSVTDLVNTLKPRYVFLSHILELSHPQTEKKYRWSIKDAQEDAAKIFFSTSVIPLWGESFLLNK